MYKIKHLAFGNHEMLRIENIESGEYVQIIPSFGANLHELYLKGEVVIEGAESSDTFKERAAMFEGAKLAPFPGRVENGKYSFSGQNYLLDLNEAGAGNAIHGLIYNQSFDIVETSCTEQKGSATLENKYEGGEGYPFKFTIRIQFVLEDHGLTLKTTLKNRDNATIPIGDGWHAYLKLGTIVDSLEIELPEVEKLELGPKLIPTGQREHQPSRKFMIGEQELDDCFKLHNLTGTVTTYLSKEDRTLEIWQETGHEGYNYLVVYIPPDRDRIAIEPMTCAPNSFNNGEGLIKLKPQQSIDLTTGIRVS